MKRMQKSDLVIILNQLEDDKILTINDRICLFDAFGDDWVIDGGYRWIKTSENEAMAVLRKEHK